MKTTKKSSNISVAMLVPHEDVIRSVLFIALIPQAILSQQLTRPIMWLIINMAGVETTTLLNASLYAVGILLLMNLLLTFLITVACTAGSNKLSYMFWYFVVLLIFLELFFVALYASYNKPFVKHELKRLLLKRIQDGSKEAMQIMDNIQNELQCCGADGPEDWGKVGKDIPDSCCDARENENKILVVKCPRYGVWFCTQGCAEREAEFIESYPALIVQVLWRLAFFHFFLLIGAFWYRVMSKMDMMDRLMNKALMEEFAPLPKPESFPQEPSPTTYYNTVYNKDHYMELMIKGASAGRWVPHYHFDKMKNAKPRLRQLKKNLNIP